MEMVIIMFVIILLTATLITVVNKYKAQKANIDMFEEAIKFMDNGDYEAAYKNMMTIGPGWGDKRYDGLGTSHWIELLYPIVQYERGIKYYKMGDYKAAILAFMCSGNHSNAADWVDLCFYEKGKTYNDTAIECIKAKLLGEVKSV